MHIAIIIIAIFLVGGGIFVRSKTRIHTPEQSVVLGESNPTSSPTQTPAPTQSEPTTTIALTNPPKPTFTPTPSQNSSNITVFIYPNSKIGTQSSNSLTLTSNDDAQVITDWYKQKIKELTMSTRSFVQTKANDTVKNVLAAAKNNDEIKVTISKDSGESLVSITVER